MVEKNIFDTVLIIKTKDANYTFNYKTKALEDKEIKYGKNDLIGRSIIGLVLLVLFILVVLL